ncbi:MAG TPA: sigma-70 family RNA polymerase sigma factor [Caulobacteraceae bacterium]|nr:sigma-70 family RNA polymerase sigma factor [Caulobacteraceae bacterium]
MQMSFAVGAGFGAGGVGVGHSAEKEADRALRYSEISVRYRDPVVRYFQRRGLAHGDAEDCAQEVFARMLRSDQESIERPQAYLFTIAARVAIDWRRRRRTARVALHDPIDQFVLASGEGSPASVLEGREGLERVAEVLKELPEVTREVFLLNRLEGLTYTQLAARYAMTVKQIERHMVKALTRLRSRIHGDD